VTGQSLTVDEVIKVARRGYEVELSPEVEIRARKSSEFIENAVTDKYIIYGVTTPFGAEKHNILKGTDAKMLQMRIVRSHSVGSGPTAPVDLVRAMMLLRLNTLASGRCGVTPELLKRLTYMINKRIHPYVPMKGSVGASGDLSPLSHMALALIGEGPLIDENGHVILDAGKAKPSCDFFDGEETWAKAKFLLSYKEGLALTNGTAFMTAMGVLGYVDAINLLKTADIAAALTSEALCAAMDAFLPLVHELRGQDGEERCAHNLWDILHGSTLAGAKEVKGTIDELNDFVSANYGEEHKEDWKWRWLDVHDAYSVRCIPQVHGAAWEGLELASKIIRKELNGINDDPIIVMERTKPRDRFLHVGNFHGQPLALALDVMAIALAQIGNISERRIQKLLDKNHNFRLPGDLIPDFLPKVLKKLTEGASGFMIAQYNAASLVSENKVLSHPASVDSIPTSSNSEDFVSMGATAGLKMRSVLENVKLILSIEFLTAAQALSLRLRQLKVGGEVDRRDRPKRFDGRTIVGPGPSASHVAERISLLTKGRLEESLHKAQQELGMNMSEDDRKALENSVNELKKEFQILPVLITDRPLYEDIECVQQLLEEGSLVTDIEEILHRSLYSTK
jgi:histidine ammonia-lyase